MEKDRVYALDLYEEFDSYNQCILYQELTYKGKHVYSVVNLDDAPEDAVITRDLISANDYVDILNKGIELAKNGYDKVIIL